MSSVDQLLFGYQDGHGLIAASRRLSPSQTREVLHHTDASVQKPDERELAGTWVPSLDGYLLARIWAAPEQPRPGAVWAHALLVTGEQLRAGGLTGLLGLLRRPLDGRFEGYEEQLPWPAAQRPALAAERLTRALVQAALDPSERAGVVLWDPPFEADGTLLALLDAIPPATRAQLSFRTLEQARPGPGRYRLQVAAVLGGHPAGPGDLVIDARQAASATAPPWASLLDESAVAARQREFVRRYGADDALVAGFPGPRQVPALRLGLLGRTDDVDRLWQTGEEERLVLLCDFARNFDTVQLDLEQRISRLAQTEPHAALRLVERVRSPGRQSRPSPAAQDSPTPERN